MNQAIRADHDLQFQRVLLVLKVSVFAGLLLVLGRVAQLQIAPSEQLSQHIQPRATTTTLGATRGDLLDRRGRVIATTRVASRVIVDPVTIEANLDEAVVGLSQTLGVNPGELGRQIIGAIVENKRRAGVIDRIEQRAAEGLPPELDEDGQEIKQPRLSRYLPISGLLTMEQADAVRTIKSEQRLSGIFLEEQQVRQGSAMPLVGSIVGKLGFPDEEATERSGILGAEEMFDEQLEGVDGSLTYVRDARGGPLWVQRGAWVEEQRGADVRMSIDLEIQRIVLEELNWGAENANSAGARAVVINPHTGEVLAMADVIREIPDLVEFPWHDPKGEVPAATLPDEKERPRYRVLQPDDQRGKDDALSRNRCVRDLYEPGSTLKPFSWALAKTQGLLPDDEVLEFPVNYFQPYSGRSVDDVTYRKELDWDGVLAFSSNMGMAIATSRLDFMDTRQTIKALGFGSKSGLGIMGEEAGIVTSKKNWTKWTQTSVGMGYEIAVTPVQMVRAFSVFAREGEMAGTLPQLRLTAAGRDERRGLTRDEILVEQVFDSEAALRARGPMMHVVQRMDDNNQTMYGAPEPTYSMFGKSGTAYIPCIPPAGLRRPNNAGGY
ncbi:MAG: hypothetical protein JJ974_10775, partial [Phycisphaerales bacterium]|nr:hypothetical protein [Phycisphaerales bacterium]